MITDPILPISEPPTEPPVPEPVTPEERHDAIKIMAYDIWLTHMGDGRDVEDWLSAEKAYNELHPVEDPDCHHDHDGEQ